MNETQKIIKYIAIAFAMFLAVSIIFGIVRGVNTFFKPHSISSNFETTSINGNINNLIIDVDSVSLVIKQGDLFEVETNNEDIVIEENNNVLKIKEKDNSILSLSDGELIIRLPIPLLFQEVDIEVGAGRVDIKELSAANLKLELGAGKVVIDNLNVSSECEIDGGAGNIDIKNANLNNLDLDMGVGKLTLTSVVTGNSNIDSGVGSLEVNLVGTIDDYKISLKKGLGEAVVDSVSLGDNSTYGKGNNIIKVNGGVGSINIKFTN